MTLYDVSKVSDRPGLKNRVSAFGIDANFFDWRSDPCTADYGHTYEVYDEELSGEAQARLHSIIESYGGVPTDYDPQF